MREIWKDIKDYEGLYQVSNWGRVKSLCFGKEKMLQPVKHKNGYLYVSLGRKKIISIHRLVAEAFIPNPNNLPQVNHKDEDKTNNFVGTPENDYKDGNLEWCDCKYNINYGTHNKRVSDTQINDQNKSKKVIQFTLDGEFVREWPSVNECRRNGFNQGHVAACCRGNTKLKTYKGYKWKYKE